jgi:branched-subunit amino acid aminotransferase/4-amino-4-deoxychorismate lyase
MVEFSRVEVNGRATEGAELGNPATTTYGHFTAMQIRSGRVRGLDLHLRRLQAATLELFNVGLDGERVRAYIGHALRDVLDASLRVYVLSAEPEPSITVTVRPPAEAPTTVQRLASVHFQRPLPHLKHLGGFIIGGLDAQTHFRRLVQRGGFDEALFTGPGGVISEAAIANIGFFDGEAVIWPDAPALHGITMQLLERALADRGMPWSRRPVLLSDLDSFDGAFLSNSHGIVAVGQIDSHRFGESFARTQTLIEMYDAVAWDSASSTS